MTHFPPIIIATILCANVTWVEPCIESFEQCDKGPAVCLDELEDRIECEGRLN